MKRRTLSDPKGAGRNGAGPAVAGGSVFGQVSPEKVEARPVDSKASPRSMSDRIDDDLRAQGGIMRALLDLSDAIADASREIQAAIVGVALELDQERRGDRSALARQCVDGSAFARLADSAIHHDESNHALMLHDAVAELTQRLQGASPAARAYIDQMEEARRGYRLHSNPVGPVGGGS